MAEYRIPIVVPQAVPSGNVQLLNQPLVNIDYDVGTEFPNDPIRFCIAWASSLWQVVGFYNGQ